MDLNPFVNLVIQRVEWEPKDNDGSTYITLMLDDGSRATHRDVEAIRKVLRESGYDGTFTYTLDALGAERPEAVRVYRVPGLDDLSMYQKNPRTKLQMALLGALTGTVLAWLLWIWLLYMVC